MCTASSGGSPRRPGDVSDRHVRGQASSPIKACAPNRRAVTSHQDWRADEVPVSGGRMTSGMVRRGDRLLRPMGPWSPAVHEYLRHLEAAGFDGAPRLLGIEGDREVLTFIDGDVANDPRWQPGHGHRLPPRRL